MQYKCSKCGSLDVRRQISIMANPNDTDKSISKEFAHANWEWDDFEWCADCEDKTILEEISEES